MNTDYIPSIIQITIPSFSEKYTNNQTQTFYLLNILNTYSNKKWTLEKTFNDFTSLELNLRPLIPNFPPIQGKSVFKTTSFNELNKRQFYLLHFLKQCLIRKDIISNTTFANFLEIPQHSPEISYNSHSKLSEFDSLPLPVKDFKYIPKSQIILISCNEQSITSKVDSYINVNFSWEDMPQMHISVSGFFIYKINYDVNKGFKCDKVFELFMQTQPQCVNYEEESMSIFLGLSNGNIIVYRVDKESNYTKFEQISDIKHHKGNVTGVDADYRTGYVYSCGIDGKLMSCELNYVDKPIEINEASCGYTNLLLDKKYERIFVTKENGEVDIFLTKLYPVFAITVITSGDYINDIIVDYNAGYVFTCANNGNISVLDLGTPGKEKNIKEISTFGGEQEYKAIAYDPNSREVIVGDECGRVVVYSLKTGNAVYVIKVHKESISRIYYDVEEKVVITGGEDNLIKGFQLPDKWISEEVRKFEECEVKNMSDTIAMLKLQKSIGRDENYNSDEDSLNGWDYLPDEDEEY